MSDEGNRDCSSLLERWIDCGWYEDESDDGDYSMGSGSSKDSNPSEKSGDSKDGKSDEETLYSRETQIWFDFYDETGVGSCWHETRLVKSLGVTFLAVRGKYSMCSVTTEKDQEKRYVHSCLDTPIDFGMYDQMSGYTLEECVEMTPYAIVSVVLESDPYKSSSGRFNEEKAISFLKEKMESGLSFTFEETVQTTFSALQRLIDEDFKANDIEVRVMREGRSSTDPMPIKEIEDHLAGIKELEIEDCSH